MIVMGRVQNSSGSGWGLGWAFGFGFIGFQLQKTFRVWTGSGLILKSAFGFGFRPFGFSGFRVSKNQLLHGKTAWFFQIFEIIVKGLRKLDFDI